MMNKDLVIKIVRKIHESSVENKEEYFKDIYKNFKKQYPHLYSMACQKAFDMKTLEYMFDMIDQIEKKEKTQEEASVDVGKTLFSKFVDVSKLTPSDTPIEGGPKIVMK